MKKRLMLAAVGMIPFLAGPAAAIPWNSNIRAGAAKVVITPPTDRENVPRYLDGTPVWMGGFDVGRAATGVHDDLYARAFVLEIGGVRLALVSLDLVGYMWPEVEKVRLLLGETEYGIDHLVICSTHNHEGPDTMGLWGYTDHLFPFIHPGVNDLYFLVLKRQIIEAIGAAVNSMAPAGLRAVTTTTADLDLIRDTRDPIILDQQLTGIQAVDLGSGEAIATLVNWSNHPEVLWDENTLLTADYPGYVCGRLEEEWGGTAVFISGALGGLLTPNVSEHTFAEAERVGHAVADRLTEALRAAPELTLKSRLDIRTNQEVDVFLFNPFFRLINNLWRRSFRELYNCGPFGRLCRDVRTEVNLITIEGLAQLVTVPGEIVPELGFDLLKELSEPHRMLVGLGNDEVGYILPLYRYECSEVDERDCWPTGVPDYEFPVNFFDPGEHYEETVSLGPQAAPVIMDAIETLIDEYESERD